MFALADNARGVFASSAILANDIEQCERCGGHVKVAARIEDPAVIENILQHLTLKQSPSPFRGNDATRPPVQTALLQR